MNIKFVLLILINIGINIPYIYYYKQLIEGPSSEIINLCIKLVLLSIANMTINLKLLAYISEIVKKYTKNMYKTIISEKSNDILKKSNNYEKSLIDTIIKLPKIIMILSYFYYIIENKQLSIIMGLTTSLFIYLGFYISNIRNMFKQKVIKNENDLRNLMLESTSNIEHIKLNNSIDLETNKLINVYSYAKKYKMRDIIVSNIYNILFIITNIMINCYALDNNIKNIVYLNIYYYYLYKIKDINLSFVGSYYRKNSNKNILFKNSDTYNIIFKNIVHYYGKIKAIDNISLTLNKNEINILMGENGCGKTTLIKLFLKLIPLQQGEILLETNNEIININKYNVEQLYKDICYVSNEPIILSGTVNDNIIYGIRETNEIDVLYWCNYLGLVEWYHKNQYINVGFKGNAISKGDKKKIQLLNMMCKNANIIIFDEPTTTLDNNALKWFNNLVEKLISLEKTVIICTHDKRILDIEKINLINL